MADAMLKTVQSDLQTLLAGRDIAAFKHVAGLTIYRKALGNGADAQKLLASMPITSGWAISLAPSGSNVVVLGDQQPMPSGYISECEARMQHATLAIRTGSSGGLNAWLYGDAPSPGQEWKQEWKDVSLRPEGGLLVQQRRIKGVKKAKGDLLYDVYWQGMDEFGLRPIVSVFMGLVKEDAA